MSSEREIQKQVDRAEIANQLVKGAFIINGGGALALLAFVQAEITSNKPGLKFLIDCAATAILIFCFGLAISVLANYARGWVSRYDNQPDSSKKKVWKFLSHACQVSPIFLFGLGCLVFAYAVFSLP